MKKVIIHGCYNTTNFGDLLLLEMVSKYLKEKWSLESVTLRIPNFIELEYCQGKSSLLNVLSPHAVVFGGGGYLGDKNGTKAGIKTLLRYLLPAYLWRLLGIPYILIGAGAGPIGSAKGGKSLRYISQHARFLAIRDEVSADLLRKIGVTRDISITADIALTLKKSDIPSQHCYPMTELRNKLDSSRQIIGVHLEVLYDDTERLNAFFELFFLQDVEFLTKFHLIFFYDYKAGDINLLEQKLSNIKDLSYTIQPRMNHWETVDFLRQCDAVLTTKLHVSIVSAAFGIPIFGYSFHEKTARFYEEIGRKKYQRMWHESDMTCIDEWMNELKKENHSAWNLDKDAMEKIKTLAAKNFEILDDYLKARSNTTS